MNFRAILLERHSKQQMLAIVNYIGEDQARFDELVKLFFEEEYRIVQRAAWAISHCVDNALFLVQPHLYKMVEYMRAADAPVAVRRNVARILARVEEIPEDLMGLVADACFGFLADPKEAVAVKIYSMEVLYQLSLKEPDLANELRLLIEENMVYGSAGIRSRGRRVLKKL